MCVCFFRSAGVHVGRQEPERFARRFLADGQFHVGDSDFRPQRRNGVPRHAAVRRVRRVRPRHADHRLRLPAGLLQARQPVAVRGKSESTTMRLGGGGRGTVTMAQRPQTPSSSRRSPRSWIVDRYYIAQ